MECDSIINIYQIIYVRYLITAAIAFLIFYAIFRKKLFYKKIQLKFPSNRDYLREFVYSAITVVFFAMMAYIIFESPLKDQTRVYYGFGEYPPWWYLLSFICMFLLHDTYFYWMHRLMHTKFLFKRVHLVHHKSTNPSPWAAYSFHPLEAVIEAGILPLIAFTIPVHFSAFGIFFLAQIIYNVYGHLGYELYPKGFNKTWIGRWINTSTHHNLHHKYFDQSYGLYFTIWDRIMGTMHPAYDESYDDVTSRAKPKTLEGD